MRRSSDAGRDGICDHFSDYIARAIFILAGVIGLGVGTFVPFSNYAHGAHLGGLLMGVAYIRGQRTRGVSAGIPSRPANAKRN